MKLLVSFLFILINVFSSSFVKARQSTDITATLNVSVDLIQTIQMITVQPMTFGELSPGQILSIVNPTRDSNAGLLIAIGTPGAEFRIDYDEEIILRNTTGQGTLNFQYAISKNDEEQQVTSVLIESQDQNLRFNREGRYYFWIGGTLNLENALPGEYEGEFKIEVDYI